MKRPALYLVTERYRMPKGARGVQVRIFVVLADSKAAACSKLERAEGGNTAIVKRSARRCTSSFILHMFFTDKPTPADRRFRG
jgi:hypothetical protein